MNISLYYGRRSSRISSLLMLGATTLPLTLTGQTPSTKDVLIQAGTSVAQIAAPSTTSSVSSATGLLSGLFSLIRGAAGHHDNSHPVSAGSGDTRNAVNVHISGDTVAVRLYLPTARHVAVAGDLTDWHTVDMVQQTEGWWSIVLPFSSSVSRLHMRSDDEAWRPIPGLPETRDEYGGTVSLLVIPHEESGSPPLIGAPAPE